MIPKQNLFYYVKYLHKIIIFFHDVLSEEDLKFQQRRYVSEMKHGFLNLATFVKLNFTAPNFESAVAVVLLVEAKKTLPNHD